MLSILTPEQRLEMQAKTAATREAKKLAGQHLKQDWADLSFWRETASLAGIRLPISYVPATETKYIRKTLKKLDISIEEWLDVTGFKTLKGFGECNTNSPAFVEVGLALEYWNEKRELP